MVDAEKILAEIRRLKTELQGYSAQEALDYIESYINLISREPLLKAAKKYVQEAHLLPEEFLVIPVFKAGAEWQEKKDQEIIKLAEDHAFLAGADWQKEQMMKGAVEGVVISTSDNNWECIRIYEKVHSVGDKVTVQIRKANENTFQH